MISIEFIKKYFETTLILNFVNKKIKKFALSKHQAEAVEGGSDNSSKIT